MQPRPRVIRVQFPGVLPAPEHCLLHDVFGRLHVTIDQREHKSHQREAIGVHPGVRASVTTRSGHDSNTPRSARTFISRRSLVLRPAATGVAGYRSAALLYWESITTSLPEIRSNLRTIILLSTGLVIATAAAVAAVAHALGLGWGPAWVLGAAVIAVSATVVGARFAWLFTTPYLIRALDRRPQQRLRRVGARARVVSAMAGFRGAVSLAAALAVPETVESGAPFPGRDVIIFVTAGVIVVTLLAQGLLLPAVVHWARLPRDTSVETERHFAEILATEEALAAMPQLAAGLGTDPEVSGRLNREYAKHLRLLRANDAGADDEPALRYDQQYTALRLAVLAHKRATVLRLRDERRIDDIVLRQIQTRLDIEEVRLSRRETVE